MLLKIYKNKPATLDILICLLLIFSIVAVYYQVLWFEFINYDTPDYVYDNSYVKNGLTFNNIIWAFSTIDYANWHPLTWISHMIDVELFGLNSGAHHAVNVVFHIFNSLLLYWIIKKLSGSLWFSWFITSLFALHPLHIQSVAWVAERKDVLSTMFGFLSIISYCYYTQKKERSYYLLVIFFFLLSLLSKPMLVTMPCILLLMDYWPLNRLQKRNQNKIKESEPVLNIKTIPTTPVALIIEKMPLLFLSFISCIITFYAQHNGGAISSIAEISIYSRIFNAVNSYTKYIFFMFYPVNLAIIYPYPKIIYFYNTLFSTLFLFGMSFFSLWNIKKRPWLFVGWFFFIGTLVPVIGIVKVGAQAMADRYTYIPLIGLFIIIASGIRGGTNYFQQRFNLKENLRALYIGDSRIAYSIFIIIIFIFSFISWKQLQYWKNSITLFSRALEITQDNYTAHNNLGTAFLDKKEYAKAAIHFINTIKINPDCAESHCNYGVILTIQNNIPDAISQYQIALKINPGLKRARLNIAGLYYHTGKYSDAINHYSNVYNINTNNIKVMNEIHAILKKGRIAK